MVLGAEAVAHPRAHGEIAIAMRARNFVFAFLVQPPPVVFADAADFSAVRALRLVGAPVAFWHVRVCFLGALQR